MLAWEQIQKTIDYLESHLEEEVNIEQLAELASLSPFYYQRLFHRLVKKPVAEYVKLRRMARSIALLRQKDQRILDVALELGFTSHEHFTRTFKDTFGMTPDDYRKNPVALNRMTKPELLLHYTLVDEDVPLITEGIVLEINRRTLSKPDVFVGLNQDVPIAFMQGLGTEGGEDPLDSLWNRFHKQKTSLFCLPADRKELGVAYASPMEGYFRYFAGGEADEVAVPSQGEETEEKVDGALDSVKVSSEGTSWELPVGEYVVCTFEAENFQALVMDALYKAEQYIYNTWLPNHKLQTEAFCAEIYPTHSPETKSMEVWLKVK